MEESSGVYSYYWTKVAHDHIQNNEGLCDHDYDDEIYESLKDYGDRSEYLRNAFSLHVLVNLQDPSLPRVSIRCVPVHIANRLDNICCRIFEKAENFIKEQIVLSQMNLDDNDDD